ncbi:cysteine protease StiP family protein [Micromonospora sp. NPDC007271]|uniref:cysteine protease StiP family protein n=1 Tax=Micromonospora sp. NPDC007271 TaxID=3154587 RepID=UPI0033E31929
MSACAFAHRGLPEPLHGPSFGSYHPDEVAWLLTDLSNAELEAPTEEREEAVQSGRAHYAASLPVEYQPSTEYQQLFQRELASSAAQLARAVGVVTELVLADRGRDAVLVSLARAGTPVGVLMRRWARFAHQLDLPHYSCSIVRGRGIDTVALAYLAAHHRPSDVVFVDGWTGKGAISRELADAVSKANAELGLVGEGRFAADLAVLADTGRCVEIYGTREDILVPSACLNSTVSGLVSRTVLNDDLIGPGQFHGAKFYSHLAGADVSNQFLDAVTAEFTAVADEVARDWPVLHAADRSPSWSGWQVAEAISREYGVGDVNLVKPGVGETTRVLLRRIPWKILMRADAAGDLRHIRMLAEQRGVSIQLVDSLPYRCVGLIRPRRATTVSATRADGGAY